MFEKDIQRLFEIFKQIDYGPGIDRSSPWVAEYNRILERMLENGFNEPLELEIELPDHLLSEKYLAAFGHFEIRWGGRSPPGS